MGIASGMAATGLTVFAHSFGCFAARRMFDQAFLAAGYSELPVHVSSSRTGRLRSIQRRNSHAV